MENSWNAFNCEINLILTWSAIFNIIYTDIKNPNPTFQITETKLYVPVVTFSTQDNAKFLPQLESGFKRTVNSNKYLSKPKMLAQNPSLNRLVEQSVKEVNRLFI